MAYPARTAVFCSPNGFQAMPMRGSKALLSILTPAAPLLCTQKSQPVIEAGPSTNIFPLATS